MASISTQKPVAKNCDNGLASIALKAWPLLEIHYLGPVKECLARSGRPQSLLKASLLGSFSMLQAHNTVSLVRVVIG